MRRLGPETRLVRSYVLAGLVGCWGLSPKSLFAQRPTFPNEAELAGKGEGDLVLKLGTYGETPADWGVLLVPENRGKSGARLIRLYLVRRRAQEPATRPPIFHLVGGPGQSNVWGVHASRTFFKHNDFVQVGYRGIDSSVELKCPQVNKALTVDRPMSGEGLAGIRSALQSCGDDLRKNGTDIDGYTILEVVDDLEVARKALGYEQIDLFSTSYGTHVAYVYCLRYPMHVRRSLMVGAGNIARHMVWEPEMVDEQLKQYAELWHQDAEARGRSPDLLKTMRNVLRTLPRDWKQVHIDPDKVKVAAFHMLYETETAALVLDAFVAAEQGDYGGMAVLSFGYDKDILASRGFWGDFFSKALSTGLDVTRDYEGVMEPAGSILGAPLSKLFWGAAAKGGWSIQPIPEPYRTLSELEPETLIVQGALDFSGPPAYAQEVAARLKRGRIVVLPNMGHMDVIRLQHEAFEHLMERFYSEGTVDTSKFQAHSIDFTPSETLQDYAQTLFKDPE